MSTNPPTPRVNPKDLYAWASRELLDECSSLLFARALREHVGGFDAATLISLEYNAEALEKYICMGDYLKTSHPSPLLDFCMTNLVVSSPCLSLLVQVRR